MENIEVTIPQTWKGLPIKLSKIVTTKDNQFLNNGDIAAFIQIFGDPSDYIKSGDLLCLEVNTSGYDGHIFKYESIVEIIGIKHVFSPISQFMERKEIIVDDLSKVSIKGKILCSFRGLSEGISFLTMAQEE